MNVKSVEKLEKSRIAVTVEVSAEEFEAAVQKAYIKERGKIRVDGFRPGKAPRKTIEKLYGAEVFYNDAVDIVLPEKYTEAVGQSGYDVVGYPDVEIVDNKIDANGFTFKATVAVYPEVKLGEYKGISVEKDEIKVGAADVKERLGEMADRASRLVSVEREVKLGDTAVIDFEGFESGKAFEGGKGNNYDLEIGSGTFVPGFEDQIIGMQAGQEKDIDITFPKDYHEDLAGKAVVFHVKVNEVKEKQVPAIDDEFAKDVSEFETLKELKDDLKKKITEEREKAAKARFEEKAMNIVAASVEAEIPDAMIEDQTKRFVENLKQRIASQGFEYQQYLKMTGMEEAQVYAEARKPAEDQIRMDLAIAEIIKLEKIDVTDEEIEAKYKELAAQYGSMDVEMLKKYIDLATMRSQILNDKAIAVVIDNAKAVKAEEKAEEKKPAKKPAKKEEDTGEEKPAKKSAAKKSAKKAE